MVNRNKDSVDQQRRKSLRLLAGAGAAAGLGYLGWTALSDSSDETELQRRLALAELDRLGNTPVRGGRIRVASLSISTADTLDPAKGSLSTDYVRHNMLYNGLTRFDEHLDAQPSLAQSFSSSDQTTWLFELQPGVEFHDGKSLHADDVVYSLLRHKDPATASKGAAVAAQFSAVRARGPLQVEIELNGPNADLPQILATSHFTIIQDGTKEFRTAIGTGPFKLKEFVPGVRTIVERNENYWREGRPYLDEIELIGIPDETARVNALLSGDVQLIIAVNPRSIRRINQTPGFAVKETPSGLYTNLIMRQDMYPSSNPDFVLAMKYLMDRDLIKRALFRGYATIGNDHPVPPSHRFYASDLPQRPHDPDRALYHLKKSGMTGARYPLFASPAAEGSVDMATLLQLSASKVGLKLGVNRVPGDGYWSNHWMKHPLSFGNINPRPSLDLLFSLFFKSSAPWNESAWKNPQFDQLLLAARAEGDQARRKQMYVDMQTLIHNEAGIGVPVFLSLIDGFDRRLGGLGSIPVGGLMGYSFAEHVWWHG
ncbi:ABC transporter substrate-binding protein [Pseudomaricurvus alcaniphilus]|uniref:ABC transporter substrate-binding protein n=1 Tax=Pseudomaricurvus alcaniphilus TaxID=1166482 RepID=UPI00140C692E|nr:ABC transporter substrate-binding protein [Pseudomaricurvus alcaniphilus]NHN37860.1 ABC transporter substrate-binding protein [Pseudomaricurvus alcaniphilus]